MSLKAKGEQWMHGTLRAVIFFAIVGALVFLVAVHFIEKMFQDAIGASTAISQPAVKDKDTKKSP